MTTASASTMTRRFVRTSSQEGKAVLHGQRAHDPHGREHRSRQSCPRNVCSLQMFFSQS